MRAAQAIRRRIQARGPDSLWTFNDFGGFPGYAVAQALSRLAKEGFIRRIRRGLYYYPKMTAMGPSKPSTALLLAKTIRRSKGGTIFAGGTASFQNLGITTQVPAQYTILGNLAPRTIQIGEVTVRIRQRSFGHLKGASQEDFWVLDSIRNLKHVPDSTPTNAVAKIVANLRTSGRSVQRRLLQFARGEPPRVRAVLGAIAERIGYRGPETEMLKKSLNPLTKYHLDVASALPNASAWNIV